MVGGEYLKQTEAYLNAPLLLRIFPKGKKTTEVKPPKGIPPEVVKSEVKFFYHNRKGKLVYLPIYEQYRDMFAEVLVKNLPIEATFGGFKNTGIYEKYMLNAAQFSMAKAGAEGKMLQSAVFDETGTVQSFGKYLKQAEQITTIQNDVWRRVEYDAARRQAGSINAWGQLINNKDLYGYWQWSGRLDSRERPEHLDMEGKIFRIGGTNSDKCFLPADWNCRCVGEPLADDELAGRQVVTENEADEILQKHVGKEFRYNSYNQGMMPNEHSYFSVIPSANSTNAKTFGLDQETKASRHTLKATGLHYIVNTVHSWKRDYHTDKFDNIVFQNKRLLTNAFFTNNSLHAVQHHPQGLINLPDTIQSPDEVWSMWADVDTQQEVLRAYIKSDYVVMTKQGVVIDARQVTGSLNKYKKGVPL